MMEIGRLCVKTAGRDSKRKCVIIDVIDDNYVFIDGDVRRKKCNRAHLEPLSQVLDLNKMAPHESVVKAFSDLGLSVWSSKKKDNKVPKSEKPVSARVKRAEDNKAKKTEKPKKEAKPKPVKESSKPKKANTTKTVKPKKVVEKDSVKIE